MEFEGKKLDNIQMEILNYNSDMLVVAGAGSGKTFMLLAKAQSITKNNKDCKVVILTYTNESLNDLNTRIIKNKIKNVYVYTFHKFAYTLINNNKYKFINDEMIEKIIDEYFINPKNIKLIIDFFIYYYFDINTLKIDTFDSMNNQFFSYKKWVKRNYRIFKSYYSIQEFYYYLRYYKPNYFKNLKEMLLKYHFLKEIGIELNNDKKTRKFIEIYNEILKLDEEKLTYNKLIDVALNNIKNLDNLKIDYLMVDEYQDISYQRFKFILELKRKTNAILNLFGDDYQAIYSFNGGNIEYFVNIKKYINNIKIFLIEKTYRFSSELVKYTNNLISKNNFQIKKNVTSIKHLKKPLVLIPYKKNNEQNKIKEVLNMLNSYKKNLKVFILARYKENIKTISFLEPSLIIDDCFLEYKYLTIYFKTIHASKGLEADYVLIINVNYTTNGFPSTKKNDSIFFNKYNFIEEERRLFYVAITRTKNKTFIFYENTKKSFFIDELKCKNLHL